MAADAQQEMRDAYWAIFDTDELIATGRSPGPELVAVVQARIDAFADQYARPFPSAFKCLLADRAQPTSYLRFPSTTAVSGTPTSSNAPSARPAAGSGHRPAAGEASCLNLVWGVLD